MTAQSHQEAPPQILFLNKGIFKSMTVLFMKALRFLKALKLLLKKSSWGPFTEIAETTSFDHTVSVSWSQGGEDLALIHAFNGRSSGKYIDIGAHHTHPGFQ